MKEKNNDSKWIEWLIVIIAILAVAGIIRTGGLNDLSRRQVRYLIVFIGALIWYFIDVIKNRKR